MTQRSDAATTATRFNNNREAPADMLVNVPMSRRRARPLNSSETHILIAGSTALSLPPAVATTTSADVATDAHEYVLTSQ